MFASKQKHIKRNVAVLYVVNFFAGLIFWYGIEKIFLTKNLHLGPSVIAYIIVVYGLTQVLLNVPTGVLADRWSRKGVVVVSFVILLAATTILGSSHSLTQYLIGTFGWGLYLVGITGTLESLLYDGLKEQGLARTYKKIYGRSQAIFMLGIFFSSTASGFIARTYGIRAAYYLTLISVLIAALAAMFLVEPVVHKQRTDTKVIPHMIEALLRLKQSAVLTQIVIMSTMLFLVQTAFYEYAQLFYIAIFSASAVATGIANGFGGLSLAIGNLITKHLHFAGSGFAFLAVLLAAAMMPGNPVGRVALFMMFGVVFGAVSANVNDLKHRKIPSHLRATLSSAISTIDYIIVIPLALVFSHLIAHYSIYWAYRTVAMTIAIYFVFYWVIGSKILILDKGNDHPES